MNFSRYLVEFFGNFWDTWPSLPRPSGPGAHLVTLTTSAKSVFINQEQKLGYLGLPWATLGYLELPWATMVDLGLPWAALGFLNTYTALGVPSTIFKYHTPIFLLVNFYVGN
jgi:hypothetical protein